ncbi:MAG: FkbM family methyltransferase [Planctomycetaceae bacterium]|nr:FkbM family methyltransferase [Planctomycetaceae bacterium]
MDVRIEALKRGFGDNDIDRKTLETLDLCLNRIKNEMSCRLNKPLKEVDLLTLAKPQLYLTSEEWDMAKRFLRELPQLRKKYRLPVFEHLPDVFLYDKGLVFLPPKAIKYLKDKDFIDGGGYIGDSILVFKKYLPRKIWSFEISDENVSLFQKTIELNSISPDDCELIVNGLGEKDETLSCQVASGLGANLHTQGEKEIQIRSIDSFVREKNITIGCIKLDVEGYESATIRGSLETLKRDRPVLLLSIYHNPYDFFELKPYLESLNLNYRFLIRQTTPASIPGMPFRHKLFGNQSLVPLVEVSLIAYPAELDE